jgi:geranylgeranyl pyrophosphate synthase
MLDFSARQTELSKSIGDDFRGGKITLPILLAFTRGDEKERTLGRRALEDMLVRSMPTNPRDLVAAGAALADQGWQPSNARDRGQRRPWRRQR